MIKSFADLITVWCIPGTILIYFLYLQNTNKYYIVNEISIYNRIQQLINIDEEIKLFIPKQKISQLAAFMLIIANGVGTLILGFPIAVIAGSSENLIYYIIPHIIVSFLIYKLLISDYHNSSLANLIVTNRRICYGNIIENKTPKSINFSEIKKINTKLNYLMSNSVIINKYKGFPVIISVKDKDIFDTKEQIDSIISTHR